LTTARRLMRTAGLVAGSAALGGWRAAFPNRACDRLFRFLRRCLTSAPSENLLCRPLTCQVAACALVS
jgi:hypothetical protein